MMHQVYYNRLEEEYTETYTRFYNGENGKFSSLQRMEHCSHFQALDPTPLFFLNLTHLPPLSAFVVSLYTHLSSVCSLLTPLSSKIPQKSKCFPPFFLFFFSSCLYKHNMYRNSTQTNMFLNYSFHIQIHFLWVLNSSHEPATYIHNIFFLFLFFFCSIISQIICLRWRFLAVSTRKAHTIGMEGFGGLHALLVCKQASSMPVCVTVGIMWCTWVFQIYMWYQVCSEWHLHVAVWSNPPSLRLI